MNVGVVIQGGQHHETAGIFRNSQLGVLLLLRLPHTYLLITIIIQPLNFVLCMVGIRSYNMQMQIHPACSQLHVWIL